MTHTCPTCKSFSINQGNTTGECKKYTWSIDAQLAKQQAICDETLAGENEMVQVLSPLDHQVLISKTGYETKNNGENFWRPLPTKKELKK